MDTIVTIIIFLAIFFSIMKNLQEAAKKGREVRTPQKAGERPIQQEMRIPQAPPAPMAERELPEVEEEPSENPPRPFPEEPCPVPGPPRTSLEEIYGRLEEKYRRLSERPVPEVVKREDMFEKRAADAALSLSISPGLSGQPLSPLHRPTLAFHRQAVVNGIIMSEILGPPVGLRRQGGLWW